MEGIFAAGKKETRFQLVGSDYNDARLKGRRAWDQNKYSVSLANLLCFNVLALHVTFPLDLIRGPTRFRNYIKSHQILSAKNCGTRPPTPFLLA